VSKSIILRGLVDIFIAQLTCVESCIYLIDGSLTNFFLVWGYHSSSSSSSSPVKPRKVWVKIPKDGVLPRLILFW
jgi:hypothetical protein